MNDSLTAHELVVEIRPGKTITRRLMCVTADEAVDLGRAFAAEFMVKKFLLDGAEWAPTEVFGPGNECDPED